MKIATYNILKGGSHRVHWTKMIEEQGVDLLLVQESYPHDEHLPPLLYPDLRRQSVWEMVEQNDWGSTIFLHATTGQGLKPLAADGNEFPSQLARDVDMQIGGRIGSNRFQRIDLGK